MIVHTAHLVCRPDAIEAFRDRLLKHAAISLEVEEGCHRFDVHQDREDPTRFLLVEHYAHEAALKAHHDSPHFHAFRADTADWVTGRTWWFWDPLG